MTLSEARLQEKAKMLELKELEKTKFSPIVLSKLDELLEDAYGILKPRPDDYKLRQQLVQIFNFMAEEIYGKVNGFPNVEAFGSFTMDMFTAKSDLDLSINFSNDVAEFPRKDRILTLKKFGKRLYALQRKRHVSCVQPIMSARVPILKFVDSGTGIECDISVENKDGIAKSKILALVSSIDERFQKLCFLMKTWCKAQEINSSKGRTLNSISIISLVAFHLQTRDPPILPPFSALFKDGIDITNLENAVRDYQQFGKGNKESLAKLFVTFLVKLSAVETLWPCGLCVSTLTGSWIFKTWKSEVANMSVQDFMEQTQNTARTIGKSQVQKIYQCIHATLGQLASFMNGQIQEPQMKQLLFGPDALLTPGLPFIYNASVNLKRRLKSDSSNSKKRVCYSKSTRSNEFCDWSKFLSHPVAQQNSGEWDPWPQIGSHHLQIGLEGPATQNTSVSNPNASQWPQWAQTTPISLKGKHIPDQMVQKTDNGHGCNPTRAKESESREIQVGFFRAHGPSQLALMPHSLRGYNFSFEWGRHLYSGGHL